VSEESGHPGTLEARSVEIPAGRARLAGDLSLPAEACAVVLFAHGSGSSRHSPRNQRVAGTIRERGVGTLLFDLLTPEEEDVDARTGRHRFDIALLTERLLHATRFVRERRDVPALRVGYFGASTGGAAALWAAAERGREIGAVVSRGGRPDLAGERLEQVETPTLLIVGERDDEVLRLNRAAYARLKCPRAIEVVPGATHLFEEPGALEQVAGLAADWFHTHLAA